jgi:tRNA(fMet)-specific endonuclease VapC
MLTFLLDTDICIHVLKHRSRSLAERFAANDGRMGISDVTLFELAYGAESYAEPQQRLAIVESFAARLELLPFDSAAALYAGEIRAKLERKGRMIGAYDLTIAGIARSRGPIVVSGNLRAFGRAEGLRVERWA